MFAALLVVMQHRHLAFGVYDFKSSFSDLQTIVAFNEQESIIRLKVYFCKYHKITKAERYIYMLHSVRGHDGFSQWFFM